MWLLRKTVCKVVYSVSEILQNAPYKEISPAIGQQFGDNSQKTTDDSILPIEDNIELADDHDAE